MDKLFELPNNLNIPICERINLTTTCDKVLVKITDVPRLIQAFSVFPEKNTSLSEQSEILQKIYDSEQYIAIGWNQTSVNGNTWENYNYDEELEDSTPYNCLNQSDHFWLFDDLPV